jgi:hypothetical protein
LAAAAAAAEEEEEEEVVVVAVAVAVRMSMFHKCTDFPGLHYGPHKLLGIH